MHTWKRTLIVGVAPVLVCMACGGGPGGKPGPAGGGTAGGGPADDTAGVPAYAPDMHCPGGPSDDGACEDASGPLRAGAARVAITPTCFETFDDVDGDAEWDWDDEAFLDCGCDRLCPDDAGYPGPDAGEGDGDFQAVWLAGFQNARAAQGVHDELWARAIVLEQGDTRVAVVAVDLVGWFNDEVTATRALLADRGLAVDHLVLASTHNHEGPDTMGLWGRTETRPGHDPAYTAWVHAQTADAVEAAIADLREVGTLTVGSVDVREMHETQALNVVNDRRDPKIIDPALGAAWFQDTSGRTIASLAHFGNHPEAIADENGLITSDFPDQLRETMESGVVWDGHTRAGLGGVSIFLNGTVGGMMTPLGITVHTPDGEALREYGFEKNDALGKIMGEMALDAIAAGEVAVDPTLAVANHRFDLLVENWGFQGMFLSGLLDRETHGWDASVPIEGRALASNHRYLLKILGDLMRSPCSPPSRSLWTGPTPSFG